MSTSPDPATSASAATSAVPDEDEFAKGAAKAIEAAIAGLHARGIATAHMIDGRLVRVHPDGRQEDLGVPSRP